MKINWEPLRTELSQWHQMGLELPIWWRDDDATRPGPLLDRLCSLSNETGVPVHLAVIPHHATPELAAFVSETPNAVPLVHGYAHKNHAPANEKKAEFGATRKLNDLLADAAAGTHRIQQLFGPVFAPVFVPPWNRVAPKLFPHLASLGINAVSTYQPRPAKFVAPGLEMINTHLDPIDWHGTRSLLNADTLIAQTVDVLRDRRAGKTDATEPFGVLTHHIIHDADIWDFTRAFLLEIQNGPVTIFRHRQGMTDEPS